MNDLTLTDAEMVQKLRNEIRVIRDVAIEDGQLYNLLSYIIPDFAKYEDEAAKLVEKYGMIKALKMAHKHGGKEGKCLTD